MDTNVNVPLSPEAFAALQQAAVAAGRSPSEEAAAALEQKFGPAAEAARTNKGAANDAGPRIEDFFGTIDMGHPIGIDNDQIDADLAREYGKGLDDR